MKYIIIILLSFMSLSFSDTTFVSSEWVGWGPKVDSVLLNLGEKIYALDLKLNTTIKNSDGYIDVSKKIDILLEIKIPDAYYLYEAGNQLHQSAVWGVIGIGFVVTSFVVALSSEGQSSLIPVIGLNIGGLFSSVMSIVKLFGSANNLKKAGVKRIVIQKPIEEEEEAKKDTGKWWELNPNL